MINAVLEVHVYSIVQEFGGSTGLGLNQRIDRLYNACQRDTTGPPVSELDTAETTPTASRLFV